jgi:hypothetical protein
VRKNRELVIGRSPVEAGAIFDEITELSADAFQARAASPRLSQRCDVLFHNVQTRERAERIYRGDLFCKPGRPTGINPHDA